MIDSHWLCGRGGGSICPEPGRERELCPALERQLLSGRQLSSGSGDSMLGCGGMFASVCLWIFVNCCGSWTRCVYGTTKTDSQTKERMTGRKSTLNCGIFQPITKAILTPVFPSQMRHRAQVIRLSFAVGKLLHDALRGGEKRLSMGVCRCDTFDLQGSICPRSVVHLFFHRARMSGESWGEIETS